VVYSWKKDDSWRIEHNYFHFDPLNGNRASEDHFSSTLLAIRAKIWLVKLSSSDYNVNCYNFRNGTTVSLESHRRRCAPMDIERSISMPCPASRNSLYLQTFCRIARWPSLRITIISMSSAPRVGWPRDRPPSSIPRHASTILLRSTRTVSRVGILGRS